MTPEKLAKLQALGYEFDSEYVDLAERLQKQRDLIANKKNKEENQLRPVIKYMWCDKNRNNFENGALKYGQTDFGIEIIFDKKFLNKNSILKIYSLAKNDNVKEFIRAFNKKITSEKVYISIDSEELFQKCDSDINNFKFDIIVGDDKYEGSRDNSIHEILKVHFVILIPSIMEALKWKNSVMTQVDWFNSKRNYYPWNANPKLSYFSLGSLLSFKHFKEFYNTKLNGWKNNDKALKQLKNEIKKMKNNKLIEYPTIEGQKTEFGTFDAEIIKKIIKPDEFQDRKTKTAIEKIPLFEEYYFLSEPYEISKFNDLDDFFGAIANCNIRYSAKGILTLKNKKIVATVKEIGVYIKDGFDFVGEQGLGNWSYKNKSVEKAFFSMIDNDSYEEYSKDTGMGKSCYHYSNMYIYKHDFEFNL